MKYKVIVRPEAEDDLKKAFLWYEDKRTGLGSDFLFQVDAGINFINRNPETHSVEYRGTRKHLIYEPLGTLLHRLHFEAVAP